MLDYRTTVVACLSTLTVNYHFWAMRMIYACTGYDFFVHFTIGTSFSFCVLGVRRDEQHFKKITSAQNIHSLKIIHNFS